MKIEAAKLKSYVERIERLMDERDGILGDIRDIYTEAKGQHVVPKVLRKVIVRRRTKDKAALAHEDDLLDTYLAALDGPTRKAVELAASGATSREIERETGLDHATVARSVALKNKHETTNGEAARTGVVGGGITTPAASPVNSRVAMDADGCGADTRQPESAASLAGEADAPAPIDVTLQRLKGHLQEFCEVAAEKLAELGEPADDDLAIPPAFRGPSPSNRTRAGT